MLGPGDELRKTVDLFSCPGIIYLVDPDRDQLKRDYDRIRELDAAGAVFELEEMVPT
jgi:L-amino acid ligase